MYRHVYEGILEAHRSTDIETGHEIRLRCSLPERTNSFIKVQTFIIYLSVFMSNGATPDLMYAYLHVCYQTDIATFYQIGVKLIILLLDQ